MRQPIIQKTKKFEFLALLKIILYSIHQGSDLKDKKKLLANASEKKKHLQQMRFDTSDIDPSVFLSYVKKAIENQKSGKEL